MFPALSRLKDDREQVKRVYLRAVRFIAIAVFPAIVGLFAVAEPLILTLYGPKWQPIIPIFRILCAIALAQSVAQTASWIFSSQGRTDWLFRWGSFTAAVTIASFFIGLPWGTLGVATAASVWCVIPSVPLFFVVRMMIDLSVADVVEALFGAASIASAAMCGIVIGVVHGIPAGWGSGSQLAVGVAVGASVVRSRSSRRLAFCPTSSSSASRGIHYSRGCSCKGRFSRCTTPRQQHAFPRLASDVARTPQPLSSRASSE